MLAGDRKTAIHAAIGDESLGEGATNRSDRLKRRTWSAQVFSSQ